MNNKLLALSLDKVNVGIIILNKYLKIILWNGWLEKLTGNKSDAVVGVPLQELYPLFAKQIYQNFFKNALNHDQSMFCSGALHQVFITPKQTTDNIRQNMQLEPIEVDGEKYLLIQIFDITNQYKRVQLLKNTINQLEQTQDELKTMEKMVRYQAHHDFLTCLPNRLLFQQHFDNAIAEAKKANFIIAVIFLDLDNFKHYNDTFGHTIGDQLLQTVAGRLKSCVRKTDIVARLGGDEFIILLTHISEKEHVLAVAEKIRKTVCQPICVENDHLSITASMGISFYPDDGVESDILIRKADIAMYNAKDRGRNIYKLYTSS